MVPTRDQVIVSSKKPSETGQKKVWIQESGKNLFDYEIAKYIRGYINTNADAKNITSSTGDNHIFSYIRCKSNTSYTISKKAGLSFRIATFSDMPRIGSIYNLTEANHTGTSITIQTGANDNYIGFVCFSTTNGDTGTYKEMYKTVQVEEGTIATPYEEYIEPTMYVKKDNNEYKEFIKKEKIDTKTMEEYHTNEFIDGYRVYRKVIYIDALPNNATKTIAHSINNLKCVISSNLIIKTTFKKENSSVGYYTYTDLPSAILLRTIEDETATKENTYYHIDEKDVYIVSNINRSSSSGYMEIRYIREPKIKLKCNQDNSIYGLEVSKEDLESINEIKITRSGKTITLTPQSFGEGMVYEFTEADQIMTRTYKISGTSINGTEFYGPKGSGGSYTLSYKIEESEETNE